MNLKFPTYIRCKYCNDKGMVKYCHLFVGSSPYLGQETFASVIKENTELFTVHTEQYHQRNTYLFNLPQYNKNYGTVYIMQRRQKFVC
jgi:hypothetical protein